MYMQVCFYECVQGGGSIQSHVEKDITIGSRESPISNAVMTRLSELRAALSKRPLGAFLSVSRFVSLHSSSFTSTPLHLPILVTIIFDN